VIYYGGLDDFLALEDAPGDSIDIIILHVLLGLVLDVDGLVGDPGIAL